MAKFRYAESVQAGVGCILSYAASEQRPFWVFLFHLVELVVLPVEVILGISNMLESY